MNNKISIIVPCYNQAQYLDECLQSVLEQTYENWECIIVNDGSPDDTEEVAKKWVEKDSRFQYLYKENGGLSSARNAGITLAKGTFILPLDADDKISAIYCEIAIEAFSQKKKLKVVYGQAEKFGIENGLWKLPAFDLKRLCLENLIYCSAIFKKEDWEKVGGYDLNLKHGLEDWEFWLAILKDGGEVYRLNEVCFFYRTKQVSMITDIDNKKRESAIRLINKKHIDLYFDKWGTHSVILADNYKLQVDLKNKISSKKFLLSRFFSLLLKWK